MAMPDIDVIISAFTEEQASKLTGCSIHQLRNWDKTNLFKPEFAEPNRRIPFSRIYSFKDLLSLQILSSLRNDLGVSLQHLREVKEKLMHLGDDKWSKTRLQVIKKEVVFYDDDADERRAVVSGQIVLPPIALEVVRANMLAAIRKMSERDSETVGKIERSISVAQNQAVIAGTRIPVRSIKEFANAGYSTEAIRKEYPSLTDQDIKAAIEFEDAA